MGFEKVNIPQVVSSEEIIEKCDKWLDIFKQVHDAFKKLVLTDEEYRKQKVVMTLCFPHFSSFSSCDDNDNVIRGIDLAIRRLDGTIFKKGVNISLNEENDDVYAYLVSSVLDYYISQNLENIEIDLEGSDDFLYIFDGNLYSNADPEKYITEPILARLGLLTESCEYYEIVANIIGNHNMGKSSEQLIADLRNRISNQQIGDRIDSEISYSSDRCERILKKTLNPKK